MKSYQELKVWQKSMDLVVGCYELAKGFPKEERFGLTSQLQRAAVSVPSNIAEGHARSLTKSYLYHLAIAHGSLAELETQLILSQRLNFSKESAVSTLLQQTSEIGKMLNGLTQSLESRCKNLNPGS